jgi:hypothetical protein
VETRETCPSHKVARSLQPPRARLPRKIVRESNIGVRQSLADWQGSHAIPLKYPELQRLIFDLILRGQASLTQQTLFSPASQTVH